MSLNIEVPLNKSISMETISENFYLNYKKEDYFTYLLGIFSIIFYWISFLSNKKTERQFEMINIISISFFIIFFFFAIFRIIDLKNRIEKFLKTYNWIIKKLNKKDDQSSDLRSIAIETKKIGHQEISEDHMEGSEISCEILNEPNSRDIMVINEHNKIDNRSISCSDLLNEHNKIQCNEISLSKSSKEPNKIPRISIQNSTCQCKNEQTNPLSNEESDIERIINLSVSPKIGIYKHLLNEKQKTDEIIDIESFLKENKSQDLCVLQVIKQLENKQNLSFSLEGEESLDFHSPIQEKYETKYRPFVEEKDLCEIKQVTQYLVIKKMPKEKIFQNIFKLCLFLILFNIVIRTSYAILKKEVEKLLFFWLFIGSWQSVFLIKVFIQERNLKYLKKEFGNLLEKSYIKNEIEANPSLRNLDLESISSCIFKAIQ